MPGLSEASDIEGVFVTGRATDFLGGDFAFRMTDPTAGSSTEENCCSRSATSSSASSDPEEKSLSDEGIFAIDYARYIGKNRVPPGSDTSREVNLLHIEKVSPRWPADVRFMWKKVLY